MLLQNKGAAFFVGVVLGGLAGTGVALVIAPQPGQETRAQLRNKGYKLKDLAVKRCQEAGSSCPGTSGPLAGKDNLTHTLKLSRETQTESIANVAKQPV